MKYNLDPIVFSDKKANPLIFDEPSLEWLNFVRDNRRKGKLKDKLRHTHGVVHGPIANDKVNFVVEDYIKEKITADEAIAQVKAIPDVLQVSLHTPQALRCLDMVSFYYQELRQDGEWSEWIVCKLAQPIKNAKIHQTEKVPEIKQLQRL